MQRKNSDIFCRRKRAHHIHTFSVRLWQNCDLMSHIGCGKSRIIHGTAYRLHHSSIVIHICILRNFANNGRVSKAAAVAAGLLGIRAIGRASDVGTLELLSKTRGEAKTLDGVMSYLKELRCKGGKIFIDHCFAEETVNKLAFKIKAEYPHAQIVIKPTRGLCSFYAELGGFLVGFEAE